MDFDGKLVVSDISFTGLLILFSFVEVRQVLVVVYYPCSPGGVVPGPMTVAMLMHNTFTKNLAANRS